MGAYGLSKAWSTFSNFSNSSLTPQVAMSSYLGQQLSMTNANSPAARQAILNQAFSSNAMAAGAPDAAMGQSILNAISGFTATGTPGYAQPLARGAASYNALLNYPNGLSYTQSAGITSQLMSPQTAMNFYMLGLGNSSPLQFGGKVNTNAAQMYESLFQRLAPGQNTNQLRYNLRSGGVLSSELGQITGLSGQDLESFITSGLDVSKLQSEGLSSTKINQLMQQAGAGNRGAQNTLNQYGISLTDLQAQKNVTATQTTRQAETEQNFASGLQQAANNLVQFNNALNAILQNPLINKIVGTSAGFKAESSAQGNLAQSLFGSVFGTSNPVSSTLNSITGGVTGALGHFFSSAFGGGAAAPAQKTQKQTSGSSSQNSNTSGISKQAAAAVHAAETQLGVPYVWGGENPGQGFDCSGLVQWAYEQAGIGLPRTSQAQWAFLQKRQVPLNKVQEGDIVFTAGSDGTASAPGHEALMVSQKQLIQAPYTGQNVQVDAFDPSQWLYAARPAGSLSGSSAGGGGGTTGSSSNSSNQGNAGGAPSPGIGLDPGTYGSVDELQAVQGALLGGIAVGPPAGGTSTASVSTSGGNTQSSGITPSGGTGGGSSAQGGTPSANQGIAKALMGSYGWSAAAEWSALLALWNQESGWSQYAMNPASHAYGIPQALPWTKMPKSAWPKSAGGQSNAGAQITWGLGYIKGTYGDPVRAEQHERSFNWYSAGTPAAARGWAIVGERGPELMKLTGGESILNASQSAHVARQDAKQPMSHPYASLLDNGFNVPDSSPASAAATAAAGGSSGAEVNFNFGQGSIMLGSGVTQQDAENFVEAVARAAQHTSTLQAVAAGALHG